LKIYLIYIDHAWASESLSEVAYLALLNTEASLKNATSKWLMDKKLESFLSICSISTWLLAISLSSLTLYDSVCFSVSDILSLTVNIMALSLSTLVSAVLYKTYLVSNSV